MCREGATVLPIKRQPFPAMPGTGKEDKQDKSCEIIGIGRKMLTRSDWHHACYFRGTDGEVICDPKRRRTWESST